MAGEPRDAPSPTALERALSSDGYLREAALRELALHPRADAIGTLLVRANDWVVQVRAAAVVAIDAHLRDDFVDGWAASLGALEGLRRAARSDPTPLLTRIDTFLRDPARLRRIDAATAGSPLSVRRTIRVLWLGAAQSDAERADVLVADAASGDVVVALAALRAAASLRESALRDAIRTAAATSPHPAIRRAALVELLRATDRLVVDATVRHFAFDASVSVRGAALRNADATMRANLAATARHRLAEAPTSALAAADRRHAIALALLVELDPADASTDCAAHLRAPGVLLRETAFAGAWRSAAAPEREALVLSALGDPAPRLQRWAARAVARDGLVPAWRELLAIACAAPSRTRTAAAARALAHGSPWSRLTFLMTIADRQAGFDAALLELWCHDMAQSFVSPDRAERDALTLLWNRVAGQLAPPLSGRVETLLRHWRVLSG